MQRSKMRSQIRERMASVPNVDDIRKTQEEALQSRWEKYVYKRRDQDVLSKKNAKKTQQLRAYSIGKKADKVATV